MGAATSEHNMTRHPTATGWCPSYAWRVGRVRLGGRPVKKGQHGPGSACAQHDSARGGVDRAFAEDTCPPVDDHRLAPRHATRARFEDNADGSSFLVPHQRRDGNGRTVRAQLHKEVGGIGAVVVGGEPDGVRRFNTGDGQKLGGADDDLVSLGPGLEDVAGATVGCGRADAQALCAVRPYSSNSPRGDPRPRRRG